jgi:3-methylcrotonyl-CoA carboxylase alpha subunit
MIASLLIANRGEIACRIIRTARAMGIRTVAVYSDADAKALHVRQADEAVHIGPSPARESYLVGEKIIAAAFATQAEAIHPGYGFLSENAEFAQAVIDAGLIWVGPAPASITSMGLKDAAKKLMSEAGVPVTPGYMGADQSPELLAREAEKIGYPVLIKAVAGGGGKGMRKVEDAADFADALASCQREATASFGNAHVLIEKYIQRPRHIEVQVFGDTHGNIVHLFERDCSLQRRHQKVIEEAPAPGMDEATRAQLCAAAVKAAKAVDYVGAGTIEFIADASEGLRADRIWFMEMNTRLQVEHPVTEEITGVDLVEWQLRVASGEPLPKRQDELSINGWAMEARLYAEDPTESFLPSIGALDLFDLPNEEDGLLGLGRHRVDTGFQQGDQITGFYDPMLAKLIFHSETRETVAYGLANLCAKGRIWPVKTNLGFLHRALVDATFINGQIDTNFIAEHADHIVPPRETEARVMRGAANVFLRKEYAGRDDFDVFELNAPTGNVWREALGFRLNREQLLRVSVESAGTVEHVEFGPDWLEEGYRIHQGEMDGGLLFVENGQSRFVRLARPEGGSAYGTHDGTIPSPMPGRIISVDVAAGDSVTKGQKLLTLEAMKMEHSLTAPFDGTIAELSAEAGGQVSEGMLLVRVEAVET